MERYEKLKKIGEGSFGKALLARRRQDGRHCVIKEINISRMGAKEREESKKEVKVLSQLKHPNIVMYQESFEGMGNLYIVMDYCEGGDLYQKIVTQKGVNFSEDMVLDYFVQICLALKHIHDRKILHRDLKSQNIFLTKHGIVKLGDFGIARVLKSTVELARTCIGTPYYLSPEICENRPYNNKSDIWSLGCVLYELCTLKHAFEAGNMKNLVLKIIRGNYPPLPYRYSAELRALVAQCFKRSPLERPSVNRILKKPIIQDKIKKFLSPETMEDEFSHTVLHREKFPVPKQPISRPSSAAAKKQNPVAQVYGVSVARKPAVPSANNRKPSAGVSSPRRPISAIRKPGPAMQQNKVVEDRRKDLEARERRRRNLINNQEQAYQDYLKNIHKQRYEKQQADRIKRARESGWKNLLQSDEDKNKKKVDNPPKQQNVMIKQNKPMEKYIPKEQPKEEKERNENQDNEDIPEQKAIPRERPFDAWVAAKQAREHGAKGAEAAERARLLEDFWQRKREAAENKARGNHEFKANPVQIYDPQPRMKIAPNPVGPNPAKPPISAVGVAARNNEEQVYLDQLEKIRRQNYLERKALQNRQAGAFKPPLPSSKPSENKPRVGVDDPRYDPDARRKKIAALKAQAEERAAALRDELNKRRRNLQERLDNERQDRNNQKQLKAPNYDQRPLSAVQNREKKNGGKVAVPAVGLETAMNQVAAARLFRSCSEGDLQDMIKKGQEIINDRKHWGRNETLGLADLPLEVTASAMEATSFTDKVFKPLKPAVQDESSHARRAWGKEGKTQLISALGNISLSEETCLPKNSPVKPGVDTTIVLDKKPTVIEQSLGSETIILPKKRAPVVGETITLPKDRSAAQLKYPEINDNLITEAVEANVEKRIDGAEAQEMTGGPSEVTITQDTGHPSEADSPESSAVDKKSPVQPKEVEEKDLDAEDHDSDIEELTVIDSESLLNEKLPTSRSAWGANAKPVTVFNEQTTKNESIENNVEEKKVIKENIVDETKLQQDKADERQEKMTTESEQVLFKKTLHHKGKDDDNDLELKDISADDDSFHTPNASLLETRKKGLNSGLYDSPPKILRTTSLPGLRMLSGDENEKDNSGSVEQLDEDEKSDENASTEVDDPEKEKIANDAGAIENESNEEFEADHEDHSDEDEKEISDEDKSDEELEDYEHMLDSLRGVLNSADASPPSSAKVTTSKDDQFELPDESNSRSSSSASKSNDEEWDSDEGDDDEDDNVPDIGTTKDQSKALTRTEKRVKARETLFQRIEESRKVLEDELGTERFIKVYRYIQAMQDNQDDDTDFDPTNDPEIGDLLEGEKEHLYQRILYLVLADAAYFEGND